MKLLLSIHNLKKNYHTKQGEIKAVEHFSYDMKEGEFVSIVGPSGCGKSTILSILCGLDKKSSGKIIKRENLKIGYMLQQDGLFPWRTILENCYIGLELQNDLTNENKEYVKSLLETYGLKEFMNAYPSSLSGGMRQRVALIRTLATKPDLLLLDEPFSALDAHTRLVVCDDVWNIIKKEHKSAIMVTHDVEEAISCSDQVIVLTERPASIKQIYPIQLTDKTSPIHNRSCKEFSSYYNQIWKDIDFHV